MAFDVRTIVGTRLNIAVIAVAFPAYLLHGFCRSGITSRCSKPQGVSAVTVLEMSA